MTEQKVLFHLEILVLFDCLIEIQILNMQQYHQIRDYTLLQQNRQRGSQVLGNIISP